MVSIEPAALAAMQPERAHPVIALVLDYRPVTEIHEPVMQETIRGGRITACQQGDNTA